MHTPQVLQSRHALWHHASCQCGPPPRLGGVCARMSAQPALELRVANLSRGQVLELFKSLGALLRGGQLQADEGEQLLRGRLSLDVARCLTDGVVVWCDTLAPAAGAAAGTVQPMRTQVCEAAAPRYERATCELLSPPSATRARSMLLPGGAEAAKRRQQAEAAAVVNGADEDAMGDAYAAALVTPAKRQRVGMQQCWNCGSYDHGISGCPLPLDQERIAAERAWCGSSGPNPLRHRYFEGVDAPGAAAGSVLVGGVSAQLRASARPGQLSAALAAALGLPSPDAPLPWAGRMEALGPPPLPPASPDHSTEGVPLLFFGDAGDDDDDDAGSSEGHSSHDGEQQQQQQQQEEEEPAAAPAGQPDGGPAPPLSCDAQGGAAAASEGGVVVPPVAQLQQEEVTGVAKAPRPPAAAQQQPHEPVR